MSAWSSFLPDRINSFYLPNSINENEVNKIFNVSKNEVQFKNGIDHRKFNIVNNDLMTYIHLNIFN